MHSVKQFVIFMCMLFFVLSTHSIAIANDEVISKGHAKSLINEHIKYSPSIEIKTGDIYIIEYLSSGKNKYKYYKRLYKIGLINLKEEKRAHDSTKLTINLANNANKYKHFPHEHDTDLIAFSDGTAEVDKIIKIDDNNNVLFKFTYTPNKLSESFCDLQKFKAYGKAFIDYKHFKNKFVFNGYIYKKNIPETFKKDNWTYQKNGMIVYSNRIKGL